MKAALKNGFYSIKRLT